MSVDRDYVDVALTRLEMWSNWACSPTRAPHWPMTDVTWGIRPIILARRGDILQFAAYSFGGGRRNGL